MDCLFFRFVALFLLLTALAASASEQRSVIYEYDVAGNIVGIRNIIVSGAPQVDSLTPPFINRDQAVRIVASGENLGRVQVTSSDGQLVVTELANDLDSETRFTLFTLDGTLGESTLIFENLLGQALASIVVSERLPIISSSPNPLLLVETQVKTVTLRLDKPFDEDKSISLWIDDSSVAELLGATTLMLGAGNTEFEFDVQAHGRGSSIIRVQQVEDSLTSAVNFSVLPSATLPVGTNLAASQPIGVLRRIYEGNERFAHSQSVGVVRQIFLRAGTVVYSQPVGIAVEAE